MRRGRDDSKMPLKTIPYILGAAMLAVLSLGTARRMADPWHVVETASIVVTDPRGAKLIFPTRTVQAGFVTSTEVQLPSGPWLDSRGNCQDSIQGAGNRCLWLSVLRVRHENAAHSACMGLRTAPEDDSFMTIDSGPY